MPEALKRLLESSHVLKCGVGINGDMHKLALDFGVQLDGVCDINAEANRRVQPHGVQLIERTSFTLAEQCERLLGRRLPKPAGLRCGNWEQVPLSAEQQHYAAVDAYASYVCACAVLQRPLLGAPV